MIILTTLLSILLSIVAILLIAAAFIPNSYVVSVSESINSSKQKVFDYVKQIKNQEKYSVWIMEDPNIKINYQGTDGTVGFISSWSSKNRNVGEGAQEITKISEGESMEIDLRFMRPFKGSASAIFKFKSLGQNQTNITHEFYSSSNYPMNLLSLIGKGFIKKSQVNNLKNLKEILEKNG